MDAPAEIETPPSPVAVLRHALRGSINSLKLGMSALGIGLTPEEAVEFLVYIEEAAEKTVGILDQYEALGIPDSTGDLQGSPPLDLIPPSPNPEPQ